MIAKFSTQIIISISTSKLENLSNTKETTTAKISNPKLKLLVLLKIKIWGEKKEIENIEGTTIAKFSKPKPETQAVIPISI